MPNFFVRHERLFSLIGAGIVFATFVVKDNLREKWKGTAEALEHSQTDFSTRAQIDQLLKEQHRLFDLVDVMGKKGGKGAFVDVAENAGAGTPPGYWGAVNIEIMKEEVRSSDSQLATVEELVGKVNDPDLIERWNLLHDRLAAIDKGLDDETEVEPEQEPPPSLQFIHSGLAEQISETLGMPPSPHPPASKLAAEIISKARVVYASNKKKATIAGWVTNAFFVLGWGLGIVGTFSKETPKKAELDNLEAEVSF